MLYRNGKKYSIVVEEPRAGSALQNDNPQIEHTTVTLEMSEDLIELIKIAMHICLDTSADPRQKGRLKIQYYSICSF